MISQKGFYGMISGMLTTALLQPFETVKMAIMVPPHNMTLTTNFIKNYEHAIKYIINHNGYRGLYKGFFAATTKAGLGCYIYFTVLRYLQHKQHTPFQDFIHSSFARIMSTFFTNALSIIQTRWELAHFHRYKSIIGAALDIYQKEGIQGYFSGALTSCLKQGFFAGLYYMMYEQLKHVGLNKFASGIISGVISTAITHPFQLIRARIQTLGIHSPYTLGGKHITREVKQLIKSGQWMKGVAPRLFKKPLANTMTFLFFQVIEEYKQKQKKAN